MALNYTNAYIVWKRCLVAQTPKKKWADDSLPVFLFFFFFILSAESIPCSAGQFLKTYFISICIRAEITILRFLSQQNSGVERRVCVSLMPSLVDFSKPFIHYKEKVDIYRVYSVIQRKILPGLTGNPAHKCSESWCIGNKRRSSSGERRERQSEKLWSKADEFQDILNLQDHETLLHNPTADLLQNVRQNKTMAGKGFPSWWNPFAIQGVTRDAISPAASESERKQPSRRVRRKSGWEKEKNNN